MTVLHLHVEKSADRLYTVTVQARWFVWESVHAERQLGLSLATDFDPSLGIPGLSGRSCYIP